MVNTNRNRTNTNRQQSPAKPAPVVSGEAGDPSIDPPVTDAQTAATQAAMEGQDANVIDDDPVDGTEGDADATETGADGEDGQDDVPPADSPAEPVFVPEGHTGGDGYDPDVKPKGRVLEPGDELSIPVIQDEQGVHRAAEDVYRRVFANGANRSTFVLLVNKGAQVNPNGTVPSYR